MNLYDFNEQTISQMPPLSASEIQKLKDDINALCRKEDDYFLLYGIKISYFTLFHKVYDENEHHFGSTVVEILQELGDIITYNSYEDAYEIWIKKDEKVNHFMLMNWDEGMVKYHG